MLRASAEQTGQDFEPRGLAHDDVDTHIAAARALLDFTDAVVRPDLDQISERREQLLAEVGEAGTVRAAAVAANFQMMNILVDASGTPIGASQREWADIIDIPEP